MQVAASFNVPDVAPSSRLPFWMKDSSEILGISFPKQQPLHILASSCFDVGLSLNKPYISNACRLPLDLLRSLSKMPDNKAEEHSATDQASSTRRFCSTVSVLCLYLGSTRESHDVQVTCIRTCGVVHFIWPRGPQLSQP